MIILGIDPGTTMVGFGLIEKNKDKVIFKKAGLLEINSKSSEIEKLVKQRLALQKIIKLHKPDAAAVEKLFFFKNAKTAMPVAQARGVVIETLAEAKIPIYEYTPLQVKQAVSAYGRASKKQVQKMIRLLLNLNEEPKPDDVADALAIAICCANSIRYVS